MPRLTIIYDLEDRTLAIDGTENIQLASVELPASVPLLDVVAAVEKLLHLLCGTDFVPKGSGTGPSRPC